MGTQNMTRIILASLFIAAAVSAVPNDITDAGLESLWQGFVSDHSKVYRPHEVERKYQIFKDNVAFIADHNANHADKLGYTVGINEFADMTNAEFKRTMTGLNALQNKVQDKIKILPEATATSVDWTTKNAVTPIKNQGQCGSCWAFSTTGSVEGINAISTGKLQSFSEQELVSCAGSYGNQGCNGGLMDDGFKYIKAKGHVLESKYKYTGKTGKCTSSKTENPAVKVNGYHDVKANSESQLMAAVQQQPVSVAIEADQSGFQFYKSGVFSGKCGTNLDHGVLAVGYGTDGGKDYWKVKNSWGASWGQKGYIMLARNVKSKKGQCGIASQPSYPTMAKESLVTPLTSTPSGTYTGTTSEFGAHVKATLTIIDTKTVHIDVEVTGITTVSVNCPTEAYTISGSTITLTNKDTAGDCLHDDLAKDTVTLNSVSYDTSSDSITIKVHKILNISVKLTKGSSALEMTQQ